MTALRLETLLTHPKGFGLETATPLQRAICRAMDGVALGDLWELPEIRAAFGGVAPPVGKAPRIFLILAGIRGGKSMIAAAKAIADSQNADLKDCSVGDEIRIPVLATQKDTAGAVFNHIVAQLMSKPALRALLVGDPTTDAVKVRHPSGRIIEIKVTALARAGATLIGRWLSGCIFDEAPRMAGEEDSKKSLDDALNAIAGRMRGQITMIGSPHAPFGPVYEMVQQHFGKPSEDIVVVRAPGPAMNPVYWTPKMCADLARSNPTAHRTDVLGEFSDPEEALFSSLEVEAATRREPLELPREDGMHYSAAMDPATRGNAWTLVVVKGRGLGGASGLQPTYEVVLSRQWVGSKASPLRPDVVLGEIAELCAKYDIDTVISDQHAIDALQDLAQNHGLTVLEHKWDATNRLKLAEHVKLLVSEKCLTLCPDPALRTDLLTARKRVTQNGVTLELPKSADGRHCDFLPALASALEYAPEMPDGAAEVRDELLDAALARVASTYNEDALEGAAMRLGR